METLETEYYIRWYNKLDIGDADMYNMSEKKKGKARKQYLIVCYKMIGINTYNVFVFDL